MGNADIERVNTPGLSVVKAGEIAGQGALVLCHGFGADSSDLLPLKDYIPVNTAHQSIAWLFPEAPISLKDFNIPGGRIWFPDKPAEINAALSGAYFTQLPEQNPAGLHRAAELLLETLTYLGCSLPQCIIGGFSQGSMVALEAALVAEEKPKALLILSGALIARGHWRSLMRRSAGFPVFQSHGTRDPVLNPEYARELHTLLREEGFSPHFFEFSGCHGIPEPVIQQIAAFISSIA
jgi:phospholipase/carboxylesterase